MLYIQCRDETDDMLWNGRDEDGNTRSVRVRKVKALSVMMVIGTLICKGR